MNAANCCVQQAKGSNMIKLLMILVVFSVAAMSEAQVQREVGFCLKSTCVESSCNYAGCGCDLSEAQPVMKIFRVSKNKLKLTKFDDSSAVIIEGKYSIKTKNYVLELTVGDAFEGYGIRMLATKLPLSYPAQLWSYYRFGKSGPFKTINSLGDYCTIDEDLGFPNSFDH